MSSFSGANAKGVLLAMAAVYFLALALILVFGEQCYDLFKAATCYHPCEHGCEVALGILQHGEFASIDKPGQAYTFWPPGYAFFVLPFLWAGDSHSLLGAVIFQAILLFAVGLALRGAVEAHLPGYGSVMMAMFIFNPNAIALALLPKTDLISALCYTMAFICLLDYLRDDKVWRIALVGVLIGMAVLIRPTGQFLVILLPVVTVLMTLVGPHRARPLRALAHGLVGSVLAFCLIFPWMAYVNFHGDGYRLTSMSSEYVFLRDNIGAMDAHLAGRPMNQRLDNEYDANVERQLSLAIPNWSKLSDAEQYRERVVMARRQIFSYSLRDYIFPLARSAAQFFATGGDGYLLTLFGIKYHEQYGAADSRPVEGNPATILAIKIVAKGYAGILRLLGLLGIIWLVWQRRYAILVVCFAPILYFQVLHLWGGWSRFRLPVEAPLALLAVFGVVLLLNWRQRRGAPDPAVGA